MNQRERRFLRKAAVLDKIGCSNSKLYRLIAEGEFPAPYHIGSSARWAEDEVDAYLERIMAEQRGERPLTLRLDELPADVREALGRLLDAWRGDDFAELERAWEEFRAAKLASLDEDAAGAPADALGAGAPADAGGAAWLGRGRS